MLFFGLRTVITVHLFGRWCKKIRPGILHASMSQRWSEKIQGCVHRPVLVISDSGVRRINNLLGFPASASHRNVIFRTSGATKKFLREFGKNLLLQHRGIELDDEP